ncbi:MAG: 3'-5' exonuclease domain-containing protein 2 [Muribaculaceae bacterium]|nr:3'-5' exonuclease domain-containing protein 2 [Muribaculaceae bacterium]
MFELSISKEQLQDMPIETYPGKIVMIDTYDKFERAIVELNKLTIAGVDTESRPVFKKGQSTKVALVQIATQDTCYLIRLNMIGGIPKDLLRWFENDNILKIGLSLKDDIMRLHAMGNFEPKSFIDLQPFVKNYSIRDNGLQRIYAIVFGKKISKVQKLTNWAQEELTEVQQKYAAIDAWACLKIYNYLKAGNFDPLSSPYVVTD